MHYQTVSEPATIRKLVSVLHKSSGEVLKKKPKLVSFFFVQFGSRPEKDSQSGYRRDVAVHCYCAVFSPLRCLSKGMNAMVEIQTQRPISLELYKDYKELGRFMLRYVGSTIAAGVVTEVTSAQSLINLHRHCYCAIKMIVQLPSNHKIGFSFDMDTCQMCLWSVDSLSLQLQRSKQIKFLNGRI